MELAPVALRQVLRSPQVRTVHQVRLGRRKTFCDPRKIEQRKTEIMLRNLTHPLFLMRW